MVLTWQGVREGACVAGADATVWECRAAIWRGSVVCMRIVWVSMVLVGPGGRVGVVVRGTLRVADRIVVVWSGLTRGVVLGVVGIGVGGVGL